MIRNYEPKDLNALYEIYSYYVIHTPYNFDIKPMAKSQFKKQLDEVLEHSPIFVACHNEHPIGYAYVHPAFSKEAYRYCMEVTIYFKEGPHYGLASPLLRHLEQSCLQRNYRWLIACITDTNCQSIDFHLRHGYTYSGALPQCGLKENHWYGVVWLTKDLYATQDKPFVAHTATVTGAVTIGRDSSVWYGSVIRADSAPISIGSQTNVQDNCTLHASTHHPLCIGNQVTIGHNAIVHGCVVEDEVLIGMGAIVMDGAHIGQHSIIGAGALVPEGKIIPENSVVMGCPGKIVHSVTDAQIQQILDNAQEYVDYAKQMRAGRH